MASSLEGGLRRVAEDRAGWREGFQRRGLSSESAPTLAIPLYPPSKGELDLPP
jgi:hypothetical protein